MKSRVLCPKPSLVLGFALSLLPAAALGQHYQQTNLVSNVSVTPPATFSDPNLQNAWGLVHGPGTPWWISNNAGGTSTLYTGAGGPKSETQASLFGGAAGRPYDPCYHQACDTIENINREVLEQNTRALVRALNTTGRASILFEP